ncbi:MAG: DUF3592 domain-containing protein [Mesorhizobium sp.]|uniref:DUF3592 domain-containing protein n=1 Tax=unclassified Mesorhizobium TaxID=325217 RepID=UPI000F764A18|nr:MULTISPECIES: DUF3592 domain-containing protein [unclassified Mesorhizobium]AZO67631.1 DUF3592 domain-containing protein [Mesorhizobium sp. M6A.T.Cr.TU.016.01.1.1]RWP75856.1 MAG: DUF3592 domain-containing protein [Mesorhizobium sp.]RWQ88437.1 MAG: DUF3592 domain-containing protein [Mesorhizobium sp.]
MELKFLLIGFACVVAGMLTVATLLKWREVRAVSRWLPAPGKIVSSRAEARVVTSLGSGSERRGSTETRNFPAITFEYKVGGKTFRSSSYSVQENLGNFAVPETLARFPKGADVTVFYDPSDPAKAVIERTMPDGALKFMAQLSAGLVIGALVLVFSVGGLLEAIGPHLPMPQNLGAAALLLVMGLFILRMGFAQKSLAERAAKWPITTGRIDASGLQKFQIRDRLQGGGYRPWRTVFKSRVVYSYSVVGQRYAADRIAFGSNVTASLPSLVSGQSERYLQGDKVEVRYDPANPAAAVLECRVRGLWVLWVSASAFLAGAALLVGVV